MNTRIILHLCKTDWLRLRWWLVGFWLMVGITALPWWLHDPAGVVIPNPYPVVPDIRVGGNVPLPDEVRAQFSAAWGLRGLATLGGGWMLLLAGAMGVHGRSLLRVSPVRMRERVIGVGVLLGLTLVLPQVICGAVNLALHGFSGGVIARAALAYASVTWLTLGGCALFAAWCGSVWRWFAGAAGLVAAMVVCKMVYPDAVSFLTNQFRLQLWAPVCGPRVLVFCGVLIILLGCGLPWARRRLADLPRILVAVGLVMVVAVAVVRLPVYGAVPPPVRVAEAVTLDFSGIRPEFLEGAMRPSYETKRSNERAAIEEPGLSVGGIVVTHGCPEGYYVAWRPVGGATLSQAGKTLAVCASPLRYREGKSFSFSSMMPAIGMVEAGPEVFDGYFRPPVFGDTDRRAQLAALPRGYAMLPGGIPAATTVGHNLSIEPFPAPIRLAGDAPVVLDVPLSGTVYRYERMVDALLTDEPVTVRDGRVTYQIRKLTGPAGNLLADVVVTHPAVGFGRSAEEVDWNSSPTEPCQAFLQLPEPGRLLPASVIWHTDGPLLSGAGWHREVYGWSKPWGMADNQVPKFNAAGARLILLKPVVVARLGTLRTSVRLRFNEGAERREDYCGNDPRGVDASTYLEELVPKRPDPLTCTRQEFARWLRVSALMEIGSGGGGWKYQSEGNPIERELAARDLASYAPRFSGLMARVAYQPAVAKALELGAPESARAELIAALAEIPQPQFLVQALAKRGWLREAAGPLRERLLRGDLAGPAIDAVVQLEDPVTYPLLIDVLVRFPSVDDYERLRRLPGIQPALDAAILRAWVEGPAAPQLRTRGSSEQSIDSYLLPAKLGDAGALAKLIRTVESWGGNGIRDGMELFLVPHSQRFSGTKWYLSGKTAADFRYDSLARRWVFIGGKTN